MEPRPVSRGRMGSVNTPDPSHEVLVTRDGPIVTLTFNRPEARNAMTWGMYERLYQTGEEVDADDSIRVLVLRGGGGKAFVAGTDISQFTKFETAEDGLRYERDGDQRSGRIGRVKKPVIAQIQGFAVGGGFGIEARVREVAETVASPAPITLWVTKEAIRRLQESRPLPDGDDLIATTYGSADFHEGVRAFLEKRPPRWA